jgi:hypothetical protein
MSWRSWLHREAAQFNKEYYYHFTPCLQKKAFSRLRALVPPAFCHFSKPEQGEK